MQEMDWARAVQLASPYSYVLAVSMDRQGTPNVMGVGWWCYLSANPKLLGIAIAPARYTHECLEHSKEFTLNFPAKEIALEAWQCGKISGRDMNKIEKLGLKTQPSKVVSAPLLADCAAAFECKLHSQYLAGDHTFFIGEIVACHGDAEKKEHLYTEFFSKVVSLSHEGICDWKLDETLSIPGKLSR
jgi:flavin reductase (DIM6/NTAB) family NADH-FMN oxidoreductase RutF